MKLPQSYLLCQELALAVLYAKYLPGTRASDPECGLHAPSTLLEYRVGASARTAYGPSSLGAHRPHVRPPAQKCEHVRVVGHVSRITYK